MKLLLVTLVAAFAAELSQAGEVETPETPEPTPVTEVDTILTYEDHSVCGCCYPPCCCRCVEQDIFKPVCMDKLDICWIIDGSGSITVSEFEVVKGYVIDVSQGYNIGQDGVLMGVNEFSTNSTQFWVLDDEKTSSNAAFEDAVSNIPRIGGTTNTVEAIEMTIDTCFGPGSDRVDIPNMAIIITDGRVSTRAGELPGISASLNAVTNGNTLVLGLTNRVAYDELLTMAGGNANNVFEASQYEEMKAYVDQAILNFCEDASTTVAGTERQCICCCPSPYGFGEGCACAED